MIGRGAVACDVTGIPALHAAAFQEIADAQMCVILCRAVGIYATGLILENYASKGFHNKAKSCNWGPMAGFVLDDPRFAKGGGTAAGRDDQAAALLDALHANAIEVPLFISDDRRRWLLSKRVMTFVDRDSASYIYRAVSPWGLRPDFRLARAAPEGSNGLMWAVEYRRIDRQSARDVDGEGRNGWTAVMAVRDPDCAIAATNYRAATTGDYDLFAVWPQKNEYRPERWDARMVGHKTLEANIRAGRPSGEDPHLGNMTPRIRAVRVRLNDAIIRRGYTGGRMIHHSDEGGRPFVHDIDLPIFGVVPGQADPFVLREVGDVRQFITQYLAGAYAITLSPGWMNQLVPGGAALGDQLRAAIGRRG